MTIIINDCNGHYTSTWHNWDGRPIPQVGDWLIIHSGDNNEVPHLRRHETGHGLLNNRLQS